MSFDENNDRHLNAETRLGVGRFVLAVVVVAAVIAAFASGCGWLGASKIDPEIARIVIAPHVGRNSDQVLKGNKAQRFIGHLAWPVKRGKVTSKFGPRFARFHSGVDIPAPIGTPIRAACTGRVEFAGEDISNYGSVVVVRCGELCTLYAHADSLLVETGDDVDQGAEIATVGDTGNATGPHLHFETRIIVAGKFMSINPELFFPQ